MNTRLIKDKFEKIGARVRIEKMADNRNEARSSRWDLWGPFVTFENGKAVINDEPPEESDTPNIRIDVAKDRKGEIFLIEAGDAVDVRVMDCVPRNRHLLLFVKSDLTNLRFLCGHDERQWYVAAIPDSDKPASSVSGAIEALKPDLVKTAQKQNRVRRKNRNKRRNKGFVRQGEWFFVPAGDIQVDSRTILRNEPISRGTGSKPHIVEELFRIGGETVYVCGSVPGGITEEERNELFKQVPDNMKEEVRNWNWTVMKRNPEVYARGKVRHKDHRTIVLKDWHRVFMNTEDKSPARKNVVFLD
ncbi:MAG TPA: hypothetical protein PLN69_10030 [bacterium]|nr:hypothetical protein [bacterium]